MLKYKQKYDVGRTKNDWKWFFLFIEVHNKIPQYYVKFLENRT